LGLAEVEYVGNVLTHKGTSFTEEKRMKVLDFPLTTTHRGLLMFIGLANYFRDHVPNMIEMMKPPRDMITVGKGPSLFKCIFKHLGRFGAPEKIITDRGTAFHNELVSELIQMSCQPLTRRRRTPSLRNASSPTSATIFDKRVYNK